MHKYKSALESRIKIEVVSNLIKKANEFPLSMDNELAFVIAEKNKTDRLEKCISDCLKDLSKITPSILDEIIAQNNDIMCYVPQIKNMCDIFELFKKWQTKYDILMSQIEQAARYQIIRLASNTKLNENDILVDIETIQTVLQEATKIPINLTSFIAPLQSKYNEAIGVREKMMTYIDKSLEEGELLAMRNEARGLGIRIPEVAQIEYKVIIFLMMNLLIVFNFSLR